MLKHTCTVHAWLVCTCTCTCLWILLSFQCSCMFCNIILYIHNNNNTIIYMKGYSPYRYAQRDEFPACDPLWMLCQHCVRSLVLQMAEQCPMSGGWLLRLYKSNIAIIFLLLYTNAQCPVFFATKVVSQWCPPLKRVQRYRSLPSLHLRVEICPTKIVKCLRTILKQWSDLMLTVFRSSPRIKVRQHFRNIMKYY